MNAAAPLAGRLVELRAVLDSVAGSDLNLTGALVTGEAGVGKSRLLAEAAAKAQARFITGWCLRTSSGLPFLPVVDVMRGLHELGEGRHLASALDRCPDFVRKDLAALLPELGSGSTEYDVPLQGWRRHRLFDSIRRVLEAVSRETSIVVAIEDMHWADSSTLELCDYLLLPGRTPVPVVLTCRADEADPIALETIMTREGLVRVELLPLTRSETRDQLIGLLGKPISPRAVDDVFRRAGGNAFFTEQLALAADDRPGVPLPAGLQAMLLGRIRDAESDEQSVLAVMALHERPTTEKELSRACGWTDQRVRNGLRGLVERQLLNADPSGYTLRHALLGEAVCARLLAGERMELHASLGEMLAERGDPSLAAATAKHFLGAQRPQDELQWRVRAAEHADAVLAPAEALAHWHRAIALGEVLGARASVTGLSPSEVYLRAANSAELAGQRGEALLLAEQALASADSSATILHRARVLRTLGVLFFPFALDRAATALCEAIRLYETLPPQREQAWALQQLVLTIYRQDDWDYRELAALLARTLEIAERCDAPGAALKARANLAHLTAANGDPHSAIRQIDEMLYLDPDPGDPESTTGAFAWATALLAFGLARFEQTVDVGLVALAWIAEHGCTTSLNANTIGGHVVESLLELGRVDEAITLEERIRIDDPSPATGITDVWSLVDQAVLACAAGRYEEAMRLWQLSETALRSVDETPFTGGMFTCGVEILIWSGTPKRAARLALEILGLRVGRDESREFGELFSLGMRAAADLATRGRLLADADLVSEGAEFAEQLQDLLPRCRYDPFDQPAMPGTSRRDHLEWVAEQRRMSGASDVEAWAAAARAWEQLGAPVRAGYARFRQGEALLVSPGGRAAATTCLRKALHLANQHAPLIGAITELAGRAHLVLSETVAPVTDPSPTPSRLAGLTLRELAVLREVAAGSTNAVIGKALFMSPKTASVHVTNILRKLEIRSRVQAAAIAVESGLLESGQPPR